MYIYSKIMSYDYDGGYGADVGEGGGAGAGFAAGATKKKNVFKVNIK